MRKKILFRADGDQFIGLGHLYRLLAMAEMLKGEYDFSFVTKKSSTDSVFPKWDLISFIPDDISPVQEPDWLSNNFSPANHIIIADGYQFNSSYQKQINKLGYQLVFIDDLAKEHMFADVVVNHSPSLNSADFSREPYTRLGLGTAYALLRPSFLKAAQKSRKIKRIDSVFVCFGGADMFNLSFKATKALLDIGQIKKVHVVLGQAYQDREILELLERNPNRLYIYRNLMEDELVGLMNSCNLAIAPTSTILYELCCVKMPILGGYFVDNQKLIYSGMVKRKAIVNGGNFKNYSVSDFKNKLQEMVKEPGLDRYIQNQKELFDGKSDLRILGLVNALNISFRKANSNDLMLTYNWSNDILVRQYSYESAPIKLKDHTDWFLNKIASDDTLFLVPLVNDKPAGVVRYELKEKHALVGILIGEAYRGQNLAITILRKSAKTYFKYHKNPILAYIKKGNIASKKSFQRAGYKYHAEEIIKGFESYIYKLESKDVIR